MHISTNYFVPDNSESEDDEVKENHLAKKQKWMISTKPRNDMLHQVSLL